MTDFKPAIPHFREHGRALPDESALEGARLTRQGPHLTGTLVRSVANPAQDYGSVRNLAVQAEVFGECL